MRKDLRLLGLLASLAVLGGCSKKEAAIAVTIDVPANTKVSCVRLVLIPEAKPDEEHLSEPIELQPTDRSLVVAVHPSSELGSAIFVKARGYLGEGCQP